MNMIQEMSRCTCTCILVKILNFLHILNYSHCLIILGTGKTIVGAHIAYIFTKLNTSSNRGCVLYCCPSNKAVDVVHSKHTIKFITIIIKFSTLLFNRGQTNSNL